MDEIISYGLNPNKFKFYDYSENADFIKERAEGKRGMPDYVYTCSFYKGTKNLKSFNIYVD